MQLQEKTAYEKFLNAFHKRYREELRHVGLVPETEMIRLYIQFKDSGKTPEHWLEEQELS